MIWRRDAQTLLFWGCVTVLLCTSLFYGYSVEKVRRSVMKSEGKIENGNIVRLVRVIDGDTVAVAQGGEKTALVRILGIKSFDATFEKDMVAPFGRAAIDSLLRIMSDRPVRVLLHSTPKDRHGRYLAMLYVDDQDVGLHLIKEGLALVYTVYPFPAMSLYLEQQDLARAGRLGLWANSEITSRALALLREWQGQSQ
jgi:endonuclease YncB( thermonuclease family)